MPKDNPTGTELVGELYTSLSSIFSNKAQRPQMRPQKPPMKSFPSATPQPRPVEATSEPISARYPMAFRSEE